MPRIQVVSEVSGRKAEVMMTEHVPSAMFADEHYARQLVERMGWALVDAEHHEATTNVLPFPEHPGSPPRAAQPLRSPGDRPSLD
jgi:hypothetical protein